MAATTGKRAHEAISADPSEMCKAFTEMAASLDARNERRELIYKAARDITAASKKVIFSLHRSASGAPATRAEALAGARKEMRPIHSLIGRIHTHLVQGGPEEYHRFAATFSGGLQEYIEAVSFWQYLVDGTCISKPQIEALIREDAPHDQTFVVPLVDYLLGLCDLTGELMRFAISTVSKGDRQSAFTVCAFVREVHAGFLRLHVGHRDMQQKLETMLACLIKIEKICYQVNVRGAEFPDRIISLQVDEKENMPAE